MSVIDRKPRYCEVMLHDDKGKAYSCPELATAIIKKTEMDPHPAHSYFACGLHAAMSRAVRPV